MKFNRICVLGLGYIGLPTASTFATHGLEVIGVDVDPHVVETLRNGGLHIHEPGLRTLVQAAIGSGNLVVSDEVKKADAFIIAVPTPFDENKYADLSAVTSAAEAIRPHLQPGNLVILESTSPPRTTMNLIAPILERSGLKSGDSGSGNGFHLAYSPERVLPGKILQELIENARVVGGVTPDCAKAGRDLYSIFVRGEIFLTDSTTAETVKLMENTYRDVNIAVANEFSRIAENLGIDIWEAIELANRHPRIDILKPGIGVGGHCVGVDPWFLVEAAPDVTPLIRTARDVNDAQPRRVISLITRAFGLDQKEENPLQDRRIALLGLAYKPDVDDIRESPAVEVARLLNKGGAVVTVFEPFRKDINLPGIAVKDTLKGAVEKAELVVLLVAHSAFLSLNPGKLAEMTKARVLVDAVNGWTASGWREAGFGVFRLGVGENQQ